MLVGNLDQRLSWPGVDDLDRCRNTCRIGYLDSVGQRRTADLLERLGVRLVLLAHASGRARTVDQHERLTKCRSDLYGRVECARRAG